MTTPSNPGVNGNSEVYQDGRPASESVGEVKKAECEHESSDKDDEK